MYKIKEYQLFKDEDNHPYLNVRNEFDYEVNKFNTSADIARLLVELYSINELFIEYSYAVAFNCSDEILGIIELGHESDIQTPTPIKILFMSLLLMGANKFVLVHNHPNNIMEPSKADINLGSKVKLGTELLELTFVDQIIIGEEDFCSMSAEGYM